MVKGVKRFVSRKRRTSRRPRRSNKRPALTKYAVAKAITPSRKFIREYRNDAINSPAGDIRWGVLGDIDCPNDFSYIIGTAGAGGATLGGDVNNEQTDYVIKNNRLAIHLRNVSNHDCFLELYEVVFRQDYFNPGAAGVTTFNTCTKYAMGSLAYGWDTILPDAAIVPSTGAGAVVSYADGNEEFLSQSDQLNPFKSSNFCKQFKILKVNKIKLKPGDDLHYLMRGKKTIYNEQLREAFGSLETGSVKQIGMRNKTKILIYKLHGALGKSTTDDEVIGFMDSAIAYEKLWTAEVVPLQVGTEQRLLHIQINEDDLTAVNLEGPTDYEMKDDNQ